MMMIASNTLIVVVVVAVLLNHHFASACSNLLVGPKASVSGNPMILYNADAAWLYGTVVQLPATEYDPAKDVFEIYDFDSGTYIGSIPQVKKTYNVIGNINEHGLAIGETTFGGLPQLQGSGLIDYGSLIYLTLQRARNASEAVDVMGQLVAEYGYYSSGESFSIADRHEVWILELIGKGATDAGAVWVAQRIPDDAISAHANQARIRTFDQQDDGSHVRFAPDVISFARKQGLYNGTDENFSFSDVYDPVTFISARFCEARVWTFFSHWGPPKFEGRYLSYVQGQNLTHRMPLYIVPSSPLKLTDVMASFRNHYEDTWFDMTEDFGAEPFGHANRAAPLTWTVNNNTYVNERPISTQQTGWSWVAELRPQYVPGMSLLWWSPDDSAGAVWTPIYAAATEASSHFGPGHLFHSVLDFNLNHMFFIVNMVTNLAYQKWDMIQPELLAYQNNAHDNFVSEVEKFDKEVEKVWAQGNSKKAISMSTEFVINAGDAIWSEWLTVYGNLFAKYRDDVVITAPTDKNQVLPNVASPGYSQEWYAEIVDKAPPGHFLVPDTASTIHGSSSNPDIHSEPAPVKYLYKDQPRRREN